MKRFLLAALLVSSSLQATVISLSDGEVDESMTRDGERPWRKWDLDNGVTVTVTAFNYVAPHTTYAHSSQFGTGALDEDTKIGSTGLGVCSTGRPCLGSAAQVDNIAVGREFVLMAFSAPVYSLEVFVHQAFGNGIDSDVSYAVGGNEATIATLLSTLTDDLGDDLTIGDSRVVKISSTGIKFLLFGTPNDDRDDQFAISGISALLEEPTPPAQATPEPGTYAMLSVGLGAMALQRGKMRNAKR